MNIITIITLTCDSLILVVTRFTPALYNSHFDRRHFAYASPTLRLRYDYATITEKGALANTQRSLLIFVR